MRILVNVLGSDIEKINLSEFLERTKNIIREKIPSQIITANSLMILEAVDNVRLQHAFKNSIINIPESSGVVWAIKYLTGIGIFKLAGIDLVLYLLDMAQESGYKVFLLGADESTIQKAAENLERIFNKIKIVGINSGFFSKIEEENIIEKINNLQPDILLVGMGMPKQEIWISSNLGRIKVPFMMGIGGSFDVFSGRIKRAPEIFQKLNVEWLYRFIKEPWRYKRILNLPKFIIKVIIQRFKTKDTKTLIRFIKELE